MRSGGAPPSPTVGPRTPSRAYDEFVAPGEFTFRRRDDVTRAGDAVKFSWEMVPASGGEAVAVGLEFLILAPGGRIRLDYQFIER
jgi:hypothetical protein